MKDFIRNNRMEVRLLEERAQEEHLHQDVELIYILDGEMELRIYDSPQRMKKEDVFVINSNERHSFQASEGIMFASVNFGYKLIRGMYDDLKDRFVCNSAGGGNTDYNELRNLLRKLLVHHLYFQQEGQMQNSAGYGYATAYFQILELLTARYLLKRAPGVMLNHDKNEQRIIRIRDYLEENYTRPVTFQSLAEALYLSEGYLSRIFKKAFQMNFTEYLKKIRLSHAMDELMYTDHPVTRIAYDNGFSSISFFNRAFKEEYKNTPSEVRERCVPAPRAVGGACVEHPGLAEKLEVFLREQGGEQPAGADICKKQIAVSAEAIAEKLEPCWNQIVNIGTAFELLRSEIQEHVILLSRGLHFRYIRFWSLFSQEMLVDVFNPDGNYNFFKLDQVFDFLVDCGLKPFIDLEEKIKRINANTNVTIMYEDHPIEFERLEQWEHLIGALLRHLVKRYGHQEVSQWKLEVRYGGYRLKDRSEMNDYFELLGSVQHLARKYVPGMEVGGPGFFPDQARNIHSHPVDFWREWGRRALLPDFVSFMIFAYEDGIQGEDLWGRKSRDERYLLHSIEKLKSQLQEAGFRNIKLYITEWNLTVSDRNYINDTCFQGAYMVRNFIDVYNKIDGVCYFNGTDRTKEYYDTNQLLFGGQGLLNKEGIFKPAAFAIDFLNHMYEYYVDHGDNYLVTADGRGNYAILCQNVRPLSYYYYLADEYQIEKENLWKCFENQDQLELSWQLGKVENGSYEIKTHRIYSGRGSILDVWGELDYYQELSREDIKYLRRICEPGISIRRCQVADHQLMIHHQLEANEIAYIEMRLEE